MGKLASRRKAKKREAVKIKFKVGKKLPKNTNVTKTDLKAKTLVLKQQFQLEKDGPVSHRNLSLKVNLDFVSVNLFFNSESKPFGTIKELLVHLNHHNQSIKLDAVNSLKDMIQTKLDTSEMQSELSNILDHICPLFSDRDYKIRKATCDLLYVLLNLNKLDKQQLSPFYSLLNAHLSCAMTHIDENIQHSSLKLLDLFIQHLPQLISTFSFNIFQNFIEQISKETTSKNQSKRTLKNDPYKMTSTQTWRFNVLQRLYRLLTIVSKQNADDKNDDYDETTTTNGKCVESNFTCTDICFDDLNRLTFMAACTDRDLSVKNRFQLSKKTALSNDTTDTSQFFHQYIQVIGPLLIDCWIEAKPEDSSLLLLSYNKSKIVKKSQ